MKYDEKTGKKVAESRGEDIMISFEELEKLAKRTDGAFDRQVALEWWLREANISLALIADMLGALMNRLITATEEKPDDQKKDMVQ